MTLLSCKVQFLPEALLRNSIPNDISLNSHCIYDMDQNTQHLIKPLKAAFCSFLLKICLFCLPNYMVGFPRAWMWSTSLELHYTHKKSWLISIKKIVNKETNSIYWRENKIVAEIFSTDWIAMFSPTFASPLAIGESLVFAYWTIEISGSKQ